MCQSNPIQSLYLNTWHLGVPKFSFKRVRVLEIHPTQPRGGHPSHSNLVRGKLTSPTPNPAGDGTSGLTSYPRRRSKVSEATCLRPQRSAPSRTWTRAVQPRVQRSDHWATHASPNACHATDIMIWRSFINCKLTLAKMWQSITWSSKQLIKS